jgi:hypothetical protein
MTDQRAQHRPAALAAEAAGPDPNPYRGRAGGRKRAAAAGLIEPSLFGDFRASNWQGTIIGTYPTAAEAEAASAAPPPPKQPPKKAKPRPPPFVDPGESGRVYFGEKQVGGWIRMPGGFDAWTKAGKAGTFETPGLAANAAVHAYLKAKARASTKARPTEGDPAEGL